MYKISLIIGLLGTAILLVAAIWSHVFLLFLLIPGVFVIFALTGLKQPPLILSASPEHILLYSQDGRRPLLKLPFENIRDLWIKQGWFHLMPNTFSRVTALVVRTNSNISVPFERQFNCELIKSAMGYENEDNIIVWRVPNMEVSTTDLEQTLRKIGEVNS